MLILFVIYLDLKWWIYNNYNLSKKKNYGCLVYNINIIVVFFWFYYYMGCFFIIGLVLVLLLKLKLVMIFGLNVLLENKMYILVIYM